jgi:hypothetical protein
MRKSFGMEHRVTFAFAMGALAPDPPTLRSLQHSSLARSALAPSGSEPPNHPHYHHTQTERQNHCSKDENTVESLSAEARHHTYREHRKWNRTPEITAPFAWQLEADRQQGKSDNE